MEESSTSWQLEDAIHKYTETRRALVEAEAEMLLCMARALSEKSVVVESTTQGDWLTVKEAAEHLGLHPQEMYRRIHRGEMPAYSLGPQGIRLERGELDTWLREHTYT